MARLYKLEVQRPGVSAELFYHDDTSLELTDADSGLPIDYLQRKLQIARSLFEWMQTYNITSLECIKV